MSFDQVRTTKWRELFLTEDGLSDRDIAEWIDKAHDAEYNITYNNACAAAYNFWHEKKNNEWSAKYTYWSVGACELYIIGQAKASIMGIRKAYSRDCIAAKIDENTLVMTVARDGAGKYGRFIVYIMAAGNMKMPSNCDYMFSGVQILEAGLHFRKYSLLTLTFQTL